MIRGISSSAHRLALGELANGREFAEWIAHGDDGLAGAEGGLLVAGSQRSNHGDDVGGQRLAAVDQLGSFFFVLFVAKAGCRAGTALDEHVAAQLPL